MITKLTLKNFKSVGEQVYEFSTFDLLVGRNNSGKSTVLQALATRARDSLLVTGIDPASEFLEDLCSNQVVAMKVGTVM